ncbi:MAG: AAA family ATPase [Gammaproteobacteria bacterium]|nr:AAA family ATPase [Gammaproteobacteria bacterium]
MNDRHDLELILRSGVPIVVIETVAEGRVLELLRKLVTASPADGYRPLFRWSVTDGLQRLDLDLEPQRHNVEPANVLGHIRAVEQPGIYALLDFHPYLEDPVNIRLLKDIAVDAAKTGKTVLLISHEIELPAELKSFSAHFKMKLPGAEQRKKAIEVLIVEYRKQHPGQELAVDPKALDLLVKNLRGLTLTDTVRLAKNAIYNDGAITASDIQSVMRAKYELLNRHGVLSYEYDTAAFADVAAFRQLKVWLNQRKLAFSSNKPEKLDSPKGILLIGVQGCGKSLAAKAAAGVFGMPLLRLDFGTLYNKYHGETERNLRESLHTAEVMSPCVLWIDEIEKGLASGQDNSGTSRRVLGTFLTWMAERDSDVLVVATANNISELPPELVRKGRFDEIFFVDLPSPTARGEILSIHLEKRELDAGQFHLPELVDLTDGFSGAEIEQGIVSALYAAHSLGQEPRAAHVASEFRKTQPLSIVMAERVTALRDWAQGRTVPAD